MFSSIMQDLLQKDQRLMKILQKKTIDVNYWGTRRVTSALLPLIKKGGRVINVSSLAGQLGTSYKHDIKAKLLGPNLNERELDLVVEKFMAAVKENRVLISGFPTNSYMVSKAILNAYTRIIFREWSSKSDLFVCACCPGWVRTRMGGTNASRSPSEGAETPVWLALSPKANLENGRFWQDKKKKTW